MRRLRFVLGTLLWLVLISPALYVIPPVTRVFAADFAADCEARPSDCNLGRGAGCSISGCPAGTSEFCMDASCRFGLPVDGICTCKSFPGPG
jgi:hypothetical protein